MKKEMPKSTDGKLEEILLHLRRMDKRDRLRMWGSFFRGLIGVLPILLFLYGAWYFYQNGEDVMQKMIQESAKQAAEVMKTSAGGFLNTGSSVNTDELMKQMQDTSSGSSLMDFFKQFYK